MMKKFLTLTLIICAAMFTAHSVVYGSTRSCDRTHYLVDGLKRFGVIVPGSDARSALAGCPQDITVVPAPGECSVAVNWDFGLIPGNPLPEQGITYNYNTSEVNSTVFCPFGPTVYRNTYPNNGPTDLILSSVNLGVYQALNFPVIRVNVYTNGGQVASVNHTVNNMVNGITQISLPNVRIAAGDSYDVEVVAPPVFNQIFKIGLNDDGAAQPASITSPSCNPGQLTKAGDPDGNAVVMIVNVRPEEFKIHNLSAGPFNLYHSGDHFPFGTAHMHYRIFDYEGTEVLDCHFDVTVNRRTITDNTMACSDIVNVSMDDDCTMTIGAQQILEGSTYGCYDDYNVSIYNAVGQNLGNTVHAAQVGQLLNVIVTAPDGNNCWGQILVEDKIGPQLTCSNVYATCVDDLKPGSDVAETMSIPAQISNGNISSTGTDARSFIIPVFGMSDVNITDVNVYLDIQHSRVSDLAATITSPTGQTATLFVSPGSNNIGGPCQGDNLNITLDDEAMATYQDLINACENTAPAISGTFKAFNTLNVFDNQNPEGNWVVTIYDLTPGDGGLVRGVELKITQSGAKVPFPVDGPVTASEVAPGEYLVFGADNCLSATLTYTDTVLEENCNSIYTKVIQRCWSAEDANFNQGAGCCQTIYVLKKSLSNIVWPRNYDDIDLPALSCDDFGTQVPGTDITGLPSGELCYNVQIFPPTDIRLDVCQNSYKLVRTHKVLEWCSGQVLTYNQIIKVKDDQGPQLSCAPDVTISTDAEDCSGTFVADLPQIISDCSDDFSFTLEFAVSDPSGSPENLFYTGQQVDESSNTVSQIPLGNSFVRWTVGDECGNTSYCYTKITVEDYILPEAVCHEHTVVGITGNGQAEVAVASFDDGSHDNCGVEFMEVRKMANICANGTTEYGPKVLFCCEEVGSTVMVEMKVTDIHGNTNVCMVEVTVQDKLAPYITKCPAPVKIDCHADYKDLTITGEPVVIDNCEVAGVTSSDNVQINMCGEGQVIRTWTVEDHVGLKHSCVQVITLEDQTPFTIDDITWPLNYETDNCGADLNPSQLPEEYGFPKVADDVCSLVGIHYRDQVFSFVDGTCEKVIRTWTVLDWCTYNELNPVLGEGWYEKIQILKMGNSVPPVFDEPCEELFFGSFGDCEGEVDYTKLAFDDCTDALIWNFKLDAFSDGTIDLEAASDRITGVFPDGVHAVTWTVYDKCGNKSVCKQSLVIADRKKPSPYCITSISTAVMNSNGRVEIWAKDYDLGSTDNCTPQHDLEFTFNQAHPVASKKHVQHYFKNDGEDATLEEYQTGDAQIWIPQTNSSGLMMSCEDIPDGISQTVSLDMTVTDLEGNADFCTIRLELQDNSDICPDNLNATFTIAGRVATEDNRSVKTASVHLVSSMPEFTNSVATSNQGNFVFNHLSRSATYELSASKDDNITNGVSTLDLVYIQRHILGMSEFNSPYKILAADIDDNHQLTTSDLVNLRKAILGIATEFPNGQSSWRFIPSDYKFADAHNPWPMKEKMVYSQVTSDKFNQNFVAIKIGDVNQSVVLNVQEENTEPRGSELFELTTAEMDVRQGEIVRVPVFANSEIEVAGYQFTAKFDRNTFEIQDVVPGQINIDLASFGLHRLQDGIFTTCWFSAEARNLNAEEPLFYLEVKALKNGNIKDFMTINSDITKAVAFNAEGHQLEVRWNTKSEAYTGQFQLMQNTPNPFTAQTEIPFVTNEAGQVTLKVSDVTGKIVYEATRWVESGKHQFKLYKNQLINSGVYLYQVELNGITQTKKMVMLD